MPPIINVTNSIKSLHESKKTKVPSERQLEGFVCRAMPKEQSVPKVSAHLENEWVFISGTPHFEVIIQH